MPLCNNPGPVFTAVAFNTGYSDYAASWDTCGYWKDPHGFVHMKGLYKFAAGSYTAWQVVAASGLPSGFRPNGKDCIFLQIGEYTSGPISFREDWQTAGGILGTQGQAVNWTGNYASMSGMIYQGA